ncbi:MAG: hypothetical protein RLZZ77_2467 [Bacteroidota bacterium]
MLDGFILDKHNFYDFLFLLSFAENKIMGKENKLSNMSLETSNLVVEYLNTEQKQGDPEFKKQFKRSVSSIGANIREAVYAESRKDFIHKLKISLKETNESRYWLQLISQKPYSKLESMINRNLSQMQFLLIKSINTASDDKK